MRRAAISIGVLLVIVVVPVAVYALRSDAHGATLRATVGRCSAIQRAGHAVACTYIAQHPALELIGPIDETGGVFAKAFYAADGRRSLAIRLDSGRYTVLLELPGRGTVTTNVPAESVDMSTGDHDLHTVVPVF
jgi:hypothetical protein